MKRSPGIKNKDKTSLSYAVMSRIQLPLNMLVNSKQVYAGLLACIALGAGVLGSGLKAASSKDEVNQPSITSIQINESSEKETSAEVDNLRKQLQSATRNLKEYQAHLFRSSHPKDQAKIAELSHAIVEKEKLNNQLSNNLKSLENELSSTRKQISNLEVTSDALNSLLRTHRANAETESKNLHDQLDQLAKSYDADKQALIAQVKVNEVEQKRLLAVLEEKSKAVNQLGETMAMNNVWSAQLLKDMHDLKQLYDIALHNYQTEIAAQAHNLFGELQALDITFAVSQRVAAEESHKLSAMRGNELQLSEKLNDELMASRHVIASQEVHILELENSSQKALALASDLTVKLGESQSNHSMTQQDLAAALQQLEDTKTSLLSELQLSKGELESKLSEIHSLEYQVGDMVAALETQHQNTLAIGQRLIQSMRDTAAASTMIEEYRASAELNDAAARALKDSLHEQTIANTILEEHSLGVISQLAIAISRGQNLEMALQSVSTEKDQLMAKLLQSDERISLLNEKILSFASRTDDLEKEKKYLSLQVEDHRQIIAQHEIHKEELNNLLLDNEDTISSAHVHYQNAIDDIGLQVEQLETNLKIEEERSSLLQARLEAALADMESSGQREKLLNEMREEMVNLKLKLVFNEQVNKQLVEAATILESKYQSEMAKILAQLDIRDSEAAELREDILIFSQKRATEEGYRTELENSVRNMAVRLEENEKRSVSETGNSNALKEQLARLDQERLHFSILEAEREDALTVHQLGLSLEIERLEAELARHHSEEEKAQETLRDLAARHANEVRMKNDLNDKIGELSALLEHKQASLDKLEVAFEALSFNAQKLAVEQDESRRQEMERASQDNETAKSVIEKTEALDLAYSLMFVANQLNQKLQEENKRLAAEVKKHEDAKLHSSSSFLPILKRTD